MTVQLGQDITPAFGVARLAGKHILIVDHEPLVSILFEELTRELGCQNFTIVTTLEAAKRALRNALFDLAIIETELTSEGQCFELADRLADAGVPFMICGVSLSASVPVRHHGVPRLPRPFVIDELMSALPGL